MFTALSLAAAMIANSLSVPSGKGQTLVLTSVEMMRLAALADERGDRAVATSVYSALTHDWNSDIRAEARFKLAREYIRQSKNREAAVVLRALLDERPEAVVARIELAHQLQLLGETEDAWRQIRAVRTSTLPPGVARLVDRYSAALREARPAGASLEIAIAPDSNVNHATTSDTLGTIIGNFEIDKSAKAKSGTGLALQGQMYRRFALGRGTSDLLVRVSGFADVYRKMRFNDVALDLAAGPELQLGSDRLNLDAGVLQHWYGQKPFVRGARLGVSYSHPIRLRSLFRLNASAMLVDNQVNDLEDGKELSAQVQFEHALSPTTGVSLSLAANRQALKNAGYSTTGWRCGVTGWRELGRMTVTAGFQLGRVRADERLVLFPDKRADRFSRFELGATFRQVQWRGFAPLMRFSIERNRSTIEFYDYKRVRTEFGLSRAF